MLTQRRTWARRSWRCCARARTPALLLGASHFSALLDSRIGRVSLVNETGWGEALKETQGFIRLNPSSDLAALLRCRNRFQLCGFEHCIAVSFSEDQEQGTPLLSGVLRLYSSLEPSHSSAIFYLQKMLPSLNMTKSRYNNINVSNICVPLHFACAVLPFINTAACSEQQEHFLDVG